MHCLLHCTSKTSKFSATKNFKFSYEVYQQTALHEICKNCGGNALRQIAILYFGVLPVTKNLKFS